MFEQRRVFWVRAGTSGGLPTDFMFEGGFLLCAALTALVVADARLVEPGWFARGLAWRPLHFWPRARAPRL